MNNLFRKKKHSLLLCTFLLSAVVSRGQSVQNPGFESGTVPTAPGQISFATGWSDACTDAYVFSSGGSGVDICDRNSTNTQVKVPTNNWGSINERTGQNRYAHLWQRGDTFNGVTTWSGERLKGTLTATLTTGCYSLCFWAARANTGTISADAPHQILEVYLVNGSACTGKLLLTTTAIPNNGSGQSQWNSYCTDFTINSTEAGQYTHILFQLKRPSTGGINQSVYIDDVNLQRTPTSLIPQISGNNSFCEGNVTVTGGTTGGTAITHSWQLVECDISGNPVSGAPVYAPTGGFTPPGTYTFPASAFSGGCDKNYRIKLTVMDNCGNILEATKVILYACKPVVTTGANPTICEGECPTLSASTFGAVNWTYTQGGFVYSAGTTNSITVCPTQTTTYTVTATNRAGCAASKPVTVTVYSLEPSFSTSLNTTNSSYYTVTATPNDLTTLSQPGFDYVWILEELDNADNYLFMFNGPACWHSFSVSTPSNVFKGFDHTANTYSGIYSAVTPCPVAATPGKFLYNRTYRITRIVWSDYCPDEAFAMKSTQYKSLSGGSPNVAWVETEAPDYSHLIRNFREQTEAAEANAWSVYPNPGTGMFRVNSEAAEGTLTVTDLLGKTVHRGNLQTSGSPYTVDLSAFPKGVYVFSLRTDAKTYVQKVILQ